MSTAISFELDDGIGAGLDAFEDEILAQVVRPTARAGALVFYGEARRLAPVYDGPPVPGVNPGQLRDSIYHVHVPEHSTDQRHEYRVSWNHAKAPHGWLIEYGHWRVNKVNLVNGFWEFTKERLPEPVWVPAHPYIRPAAAAGGRAIDAMRNRMRERLAEILAGGAVSYGSTAGSVARTA